MTPFFSEDSRQGGSRWLAALPFALFVVSAITLSFFNATDISLLTAVGITAIIIGGVLAGDSEEYWHTIFEYAGGKTAMTAVMLWLLVGVYGNILKGLVAVDAAYRAVELAMDGIAISKAHGINGLTPEDTMRNMGLIASPGMVETEGTIVDIMRGKGSAQ